jgi:hypothetical protein
MNLGNGNEDEYDGFEISCGFILLELFLLPGSQGKVVKQLRGRVCFLPFFLVLRNIYVLLSVQNGAVHIKNFQDTLIDKSVEEIVLFEGREKLQVLLIA